MRFPAFLLDRWLHMKFGDDSPIEFDLASSTGPMWKHREILAFASEEEREKILDIDLIYSSAPGSPCLRQALAEMQGVQDADIQVLTGAAEALLILFFLASEPGANVIIPSPGFPTFSAVPAAFGIETRSYVLRKENGFQIDIGEVKRLADRNTKLILINTPHNPTGAVASESELEELHDFAAERGIWFVVDEVYHPIYHGRENRSASRLPNAIVLGDFSKAFCLSGVRLGWIVDRDEERRSKYVDARSYFTISNSPVAEALASLAVRNRNTIYDRARQVSKQNLALLDRFFTEFEDIFSWVRPAGGMTAFPSLRLGRDARDFCLDLAKAGVLFAPGDCFEMPSHFRLGFAASGSAFPAALERVEEFVQKRQRAAVSFGRS